MNTDPEVGNGPKDAIWLFAYAAPKEEAIPITSPVERISGPSTESTPWPSIRLKRFHGNTASFTEIPDRLPPSDFGINFSLRRVAMLSPTAIRAALFANCTPVDFDT